MNTVTQVKPDRNDLTPLSRVVHYEEIIQQLTGELSGAEDETSQYRSILNASPYAILICSADFNVLYVNPAWEKLTGFNSESALGEKLI